MLGIFGLPPVMLFAVRTEQSLLILSFTKFSSNVIRSCVLCINRLFHIQVEMFSAQGSLNPAQEFYSRILQRKSGLIFISYLTIF